jgi:hypothetical protein
VTARPAGLRAAGPAQGRPRAVRAAGPRARGPRTAGTRGPGPVTRGLRDPRRVAAIGRPRPGEVAAHWFLRRLAHGDQQVVTRGRERSAGAERSPAELAEEQLPQGEGAHDDHRNGPALPGNRRRTTQRTTPCAAPGAVERPPNRHRAARLREACHLLHLSRVLGPVHPPAPPVPAEPVRWSRDHPRQRQVRPFDRGSQGWRGRSVTRRGTGPIVQWRTAHRWPQSRCRPQFPAVLSAASGTSVGAAPLNFE